MISIRELSSLDDLAAAKDLYDQTFGPDGAGSTVTVEFLRVLSKLQSYVAGAFDDEELVGFSAGLFGSPASHCLHSHVAAVSENARGHGIGHALKVDQREWSLARGITTITWTFDPLISRNAYFNLVKLAAQPTEYLPNFYGPLDDATNGSEESDRLLMTWDLHDPVVTQACQSPADSDRERAVAQGASPILEVGENDVPIRGRSDSRLVTVSIPADVETLRRDDPALSLAWRSAVRDTLGKELGRGARVLDFAKPGTYVLARPEVR